MLFKSSRRLIHLPKPAFCCRSSTYQAKKSYPTYLHLVSSPIISSNFTRAFSVKNEEKLNESWVGSKLGCGSVRGRAASSLQESFIADFITNKENATDEDWNKLRENVLRVEEGQVHETHIDAKILDCCYNFNNLSLAQNYIKYMKNTGKKYNVATVCTYIKICYQNRKLCTKEDFDKVDQFTRYLLARYKVFDYSVGESIVKGLCLHDNLQEAAEIIAEMNEYLEPNNETISAYASCLLKNDHIEKAWSVMKAAAEKKCSLNDDVFISWIEKAKSQPDLIEQLFKFLRMSNIVPRKLVCDHLVSLYSSFPPEKRLSGSFVSIVNTGVCPNCGEKLQRVDIDEEEFSMLRDEFLNRVLIRNDVFKNTTPEELKNFFKIVKREAPFDIVIDGLNVMYMNGTMKSERFYSKLLSDTVRHFVELNQKVLIIGRKHMYNYSKDNLDYIRKNATMFLINDTSEDDPYMIYATIYSGLESCFVTRDLMRSEKYKLSNDKLALLFKRWQQSHQIFIQYVNFSTGKIFFKNPITFEMAAQPSKIGWHMPYHPDTYTGTDDYGLHEHWLCLKK